MHLECPFTNLTDSPLSSFRVVPYQIALHDGRLIFAPQDSDQVIRLRPPPAPDAPSSPEYVPNEEDYDDMEEEEGEYEEGEEMYEEGENNNDEEA